MNPNNNNNNGYDSDDTFSDDNLPPMTEEQMAEMREITEEPFTHPNSPFRSTLIPTDVVSVATAYMMANTWNTTNWACYCAVMQELIKDLPPYLARRAALALQKMNDIVVQSGNQHLVIGKAVQASR